MCFSFVDPEKKHREHREHLLANSEPGSLHRASNMSALVITKSKINSTVTEEPELPDIIPLCFA